MTTDVSAPASRLAPGAAARAYLRRHRDASPKEIDWSAAPARFLTYAESPVVPLPWEPVSTTPAMGLLGRLMRNLCALTRVGWVHPMHPRTGRASGGPPVQGMFRPAPSGGALYPIEVYLATGDLTGTPPALHHYDVAHHGLQPVRTGDHRAALVDLLDFPPENSPDLVLVFTTVFWRNAFKYGEFGYRLQYQETGALITQAHAAAQLLNLKMTAHLRYADEPVDRLLGLDTFRQSTTAVLALHHPSLHAEPTQSPPTRIELLRQPRASITELPPAITDRLPLTAALHAASLTTSPETSTPGKRTRPATGEALRLPAPVRTSLAAGIPSRRSATKGFRPDAIDPGTLATILDAVDGRTGDLDSTLEEPVSLEMCCVLSRVSGIPPGVYHYRYAELQPIENAGPVEDLARTLPDELTQLAFRESAIALVPIAVVEPELAHRGDRWYRLVQNETGIVAHRAALVAAALGCAARIHSGGAGESTDRLLGLEGTPWSSQTMLLIGAPRPGQALHLPL